MGFDSCEVEKVFLLLYLWILFCSIEDIMMLCI
jgi:hypothetical protein